MASSRISQIVRPGGRYESRLGTFWSSENGRPAAHGEHADEFLVAETNQIGVLGVEFVHEPLGGGRLMLRDFLDEGPVIQAVNLLEFPVFGRELEYQRFLWIHNFGDSGFGATPRRADSTAISSPIFLRCANKIIADKTAISVAVKPARWNHQAGQRQTDEGEHGGEQAFPRDGQSAQKHNENRQRDPIVKQEQRRERGGHALAAAKMQLRRPDVPGDHGQHGQRHGQSVVVGEFRREPDCQRALGHIAQHREQVAGFAQNATDVARADAAAFDFTDVPARAGADEIIASGETTQEISRDHGAGRLKPVCRLHMFD